MIDVLRGIEIINNIIAMMDVVDIPLPEEFSFPYPDSQISYNQMYNTVIQKITSLTTKITETVEGNITKEDYYNTFIQEIGINEREIDELKSMGAFIEPKEYKGELNNV